MCHSNRWVALRLRGIALELPFQGVQEAAHALGAAGRGLVAVEVRTLLGEDHGVPRSPSGVNSTVASETEILVPSKNISYV